MIFIKSKQANIINNLVVLHGICGQPNDFLQMAKSNQVISKTNSHLLNWHQNKFNIQVQSRNLKEYIENIPKGDVCLLGHSLGAKIIMSTLSQYNRELSHKVKGAILVDMLPFSEQVEGRETTHYQCNIRRNFDLLKSEKLELMKVYLARIRELEIKDKNEQQIIQLINDAIPSKRIAKIILQNVDMETNTWKIDIDDILQNYDQFVIYLKDRLIYFLLKLIQKLYHKIEGSWPGKVKVLAGIRSIVVGRSQLDKYKQIFLNIDVDKDIKFIKKANHWVYVDKPTVFANEVSNFVSDIFK